MTANADRKDLTSVFWGPAGLTESFVKLFYVGSHVNEGHETVVFKKNFFIFISVGWDDDFQMDAVKIIDTLFGVVDVAS